MKTRMRSQEWQPVGVAELEPAVGKAVRAVQNGLVIAGPGAGKTELLAQRACYLLETNVCPSPKKILAISFKRDAARNLRDRVLKRCGPELARRFDSLTFDAFAKGLIDRFHKALPEAWRPRFNYTLDFNLEYRLRDYLLEIPNSVSGLTDEEVQSIVTKRFYRGHFLRRLPLPTSSSPTVESKAATALWRYLLYNRKPAPALNFHMLGRLAELLLQTNPKILAALRMTYAFVFLDEFQDTTDVQYDLTRTAFKDSACVLTAVGDNKQTIMGWAGAFPQVFEQFTNDFSPVLYRPQRNYRSAPELVRILQYFAKELDPESADPVVMDDGESGNGECLVYEYPDHETEAGHLAQCIATWIEEDSLGPRDVCVLTRNRPADYTQLLREELASAGVSARVESELQDVLSEPVTDLVLAMLKLASARRAADAWSSAMDFLLQTIGDESESAIRRTERKLAGYVAELRGTLGGEFATASAVRNVIDGIVAFLGKPALLAYYPQYRQGDFLTKTLEQLSEHLFQSLAEGRWRDAIECVEGVGTLPILTMHKSKGLEYHTVVFVGLEDSALFGFTSRPTEETCGFFVAFSRAKKRVVFTFSEERPKKPGASPEAQARRNIRRLYKLLEDAGVRIERPV
jgi:superfamily I DNA/RNA helicase